MKDKNWHWGDANLVPRVLPARKDPGNEVGVTPSWRIFRNTTDASSVPVYHGLTIRTRVGRRVQRLLDTGITFYISIRDNHREELLLVWLVLVWDFAPVACEELQSDKWEASWNRTGMKLVPVSCKHPLRDTNMGHSDILSHRVHTTVSSNSTLSSWQFREYIELVVAMPHWHWTTQRQSFFPSS